MCIRYLFFPWRIIIPSRKLFLDTCKWRCVLLLRVLEDPSVARQGLRLLGFGLSVLPQYVTGRPRRGWRGARAEGGSGPGPGPGPLWRRAARRGQPAHGQRSPPRPAGAGARPGARCGATSAPSSPHRVALKVSPAVEALAVVVGRKLQGGRGNRVRPLASRKHFWGWLKFSVKGSCI